MLSLCIQCICLYDSWISHYAKMYLRLSLGRFYQKTKAIHKRLGLNSLHMERLVMAQFKKHLIEYSPWTKIFPGRKNNHII